MQGKLPCHVIAGSLGVGKTTSILHHLRRQEGQERIGVLVNDFGTQGIDSLLVRSEGGKSVPEVVNVPGGCLCCTSALHFQDGLRKLVASQELDRLIIEPSGVVFLDRMMGELEVLSDELNLDIRPVAVLVEPESFNAAVRRGLPYYRHLAEWADCLIANFGDTAPPEAIREFLEWGKSLQPAKQAVWTVEQGKLPRKFFMMERRRSVSVRNTDYVHAGHGRQSGGVALDDTDCFDEKRLQDVLERLNAEGFRGAKLVRFKGVFQLKDMPCLFEIAGGRVLLRKWNTLPGGNRADWIYEGAGFESEALVEMLKSAVVPL